MGRTFIRQDAQIRESVTYDDTKTVGSTMESGQSHIEDDLNCVRSQLKRWLWADGAGNWYDDVPTHNSKKRGIDGIAEHLDELEEQPFLFRTQLLTDITVGGSDNFVILDVSSSEAPSETAAVGAVATEGAVVAYSASFGSNQLDEVAGQSAIRPNNLCIVVDAATGQPIQSGGRDVFALIQSESNTDGHTFDDVDHRVQLSFVRVDSAGTDLEACPAADIQGKDIKYAYVRQMHLDNIPKWAWLTGAFLDETALADVTLQRAIDNQTGTASQTAKDIDWDIADDYALAFTADSAGTDLLKIAAAAAGDSITMNVATLDINTTNAVDMDEPLKVDTDGTEIDIGVTAGTVETTGSNDLTLKGAGEMYFDDGNRSGSTWAAAMKFCESTAEWDDLETAYGGEKSLVAMLTQAVTESARAKGQAILQNNVAADTDVDATTSGNLDVDLPDYSSVDSFVDDCDVYLNGELLRNGANAAANEDVYPGTTPAQGMLKFEFALKGTGSKPDQLTMIVYNS